MTPLPATVTLAVDTANLKTSLAIAGPGPSQIAISGGNTGTSGFMPIKISSSIPAASLISLSGLTVENGYYTSNGAGFSDNAATAGVSFNNVAFTGNLGKSNGATIYFGASSVGPITINNSSFTGNMMTTSTSGIGGVLYNAGEGSLTVTNSYFASNSSTGGGGAIGTAAAPAGFTNPTTLENDTFYLNSSTGSGGGGALLLNNTGATTILNCTVVDNTATGNGGGVDLGANVGASATNPLTIENTVIEGNATTTSGDVVNLSYTSANTNVSILSDLYDSGSTGTYTFAQLDLGAAGNYGGPTLILPILPGSPLIGGASPQYLNAATSTDQRGFPRPASSGGPVDYGAEQSNLALTFVVEPPSTTAVNAVISPSPTVEVAETGYGLSGVGVTITLNPGMLSGTTSGTTNGSGEIVFNALTPTTAESSTVLNASTGTSPNVAGNSTSFSVTAGATQLGFAAGTPPASIASGGNAGTVTVDVEDSNGNTLSSQNSTSVTLTVSGPGGYMASYGPVTSTNGVASFNLSGAALTTDGAYTYTASATGLTSATATVNVVQATTSEGVSSAQAGASLTVAEGSTLPLTILFTYPGQVPVPTPTGAITITVDGSTASLSGRTCVFKNTNTAVAAHTNCSVTYTAPMTAGNHMLMFSQAADSNYAASSGSATITVTGNNSLRPILGKGNLTETSLTKR